MPLYRETFNFHCLVLQKNELFIFLPCFDDVAESCNVQIIILCKIFSLHITNSPKYQNVEHNCTQEKDKAIAIISFI